MPDLTTEFKAYLETIYDAAVGATADNKTDLTTLFTKDIPTVRAAQPTEVDDANTMYLKHLL